MDLLYSSLLACLCVFSKFRNIYLSLSRVLTRSCRGLTGTRLQNRGGPSITEEGWLTGLETVSDTFPIVVTKCPREATQGRAGLS